MLLKKLAKASKSFNHDIVYHGGIDFIIQALSNYLSVPVPTHEKGGSIVGMYYFTLAHFH